MAEQGVDALLLTSGPNLAYLSGYPSPLRSYARPFLFLFPLASDPIFLVHTGREFEARAYCWAEDVRTYNTLSEAPVEAILDALKARGLLRGRIGVEVGPEQTFDLSVAGLLRLQAASLAIDLVDAGNVLWPARMRKSPAEVARIRRACEITSRAHERVFAAASAGMTEEDVARMMAIASIEMGGASPFMLITSGPGNYDYVSKGPSPRRVEPGDMVWMDSGCSVGGYWSDFSRAGVVGGPSEEQRRAQAAVHEATMAGVAVIRPGATTGEVGRACESALARFPFPITSSISGLAARAGHGMGLAPTERPHVVDGDGTVLDAGMVITVEPGVATTFGTFHIEENVLVTETGYELLSTTRRELFEIPA
jgi:Xaa-Pro aminopeptidase